MFSKFESLILFFSKHRNFRVFWCNLRRNDANRKSKTSEDLRRLSEDQRMKIQEPSKEGEILFPSSRHLIWKKTPKKRRNMRFSTRTALTCASHAFLDA